MNLNPDCVRDIMLCIEELQFKESATVQELCEQMPQYTEDELHYTALKLFEGGLINAITAATLQSPGASIICINELTYGGHTFLDNIRDTATFKETKSKILKTVGNASLDIMAKVAAQVLQNKLSI